MAQQTAVNILVSYMLENFHLTDEALEKFEQAKQMEKEQRIKDYNAGYTDAQCNHVNDAENYANEQDYLSSKD